MQIYVRIENIPVNTNTCRYFDTHFRIKQRVAQKSKPLPNIKKSYYIVLKPVNEIRFIRKIKVSIKHYNIIRSYYLFYV